MATVYLAMDVRHDRLIALKVLHPNLAASLGPERFEREIRLTARLDHPHILPVLDSGDTDGQLWYTMPYVEGESLRDRLRREVQLPVDAAIRIGSEVADALDYAHRHGVVHRDIKPENILLSDGHARVADFGVARAIAAAAGDALTQTGFAVGTVAYMSPEQASGATALDGRSDIYSLGTVVYEMLAGEPPFGGPTPQAVMARRFTESPRPLTSARPGLPPAITQAVERALARNPADRFATAGELARALSAEGHHRVWAPTILAPAGAGRVRRRVLAALGAIAVVAGVGLALAYWRGRESGRPASASARRDMPSLLAVLPFESIGTDTAQRYFTAGMTEEITGQLSKVSALRVLSRAATEPYRAAPDRLPRLAREMGVKSVVEGSVRVAGERVRVGVQLTDAGTGQAVWSDQYDRDLTDVFAVQSEVARRIVDALRTTLTPLEAQRLDRTPTENLAAYRLYLRAGELSSMNRTENLASIDLLRQAIRADPSFAKAHAVLARRFMFLSLYDDPAYRDSGLVAARKAISLQPDLALAHYFLAGLQASGGRLTEARLSYLKALELDPSLDGAMVDLSENESILGRYDESLYWARRGVPLMPHHHLRYHHLAIPLLRLSSDSITERVLREGERQWPDAMRLQIQLAWLDVLRGREEAAIARMRRAITAEPDHDEGRAHLAELAAITGAADAEKLLLPLVQAQPGARPTIWTLPESFRVLLGLVLHRTGERARAATLWDEAAAAATRDLEQGHDNPDRPMEMAALHAVRGETDSALHWLERGYRAGWKDYRATRRDPFFESLKNDRRFEDLMRRMASDVAEMERRALPPVDTLLAELR
jgi:TolB-like protein